MAQVSKSVERRSQVVLGELDPGFLRITSPTGTQIALDEQAAMALQHGVSPAFGNPFIPPNTRGRLSVSTVQARLSKNYGLVRMDPYCRLRIGNTVFETPTDHNGAKNPKWNRTIHCYLPNGIDSLYIEIFDERALTMDERIAWGHVAIPEAVFNGETIDDWYTLSGEQGEGREGMINLVMSMSAVDAPPPVAYIPMTQPVMVPGGGYAIPIRGGWPQRCQPQPPQQQSIVISDDDVKELVDMFPAMESEVIRSVLEEKRGNKEAAVNALLSMG